MKKIFSLLSVALLSCNANAHILIDGLFYHLDESTSTASVVGLFSFSYCKEHNPDNYNPVELKYHGDVVIPDHIKYHGKSYTITTIGEGAFNELCELYGGYNNERLEHISLPSTITKIEDYAFVDCFYTKFNIPNSVSAIGRCAFQGCFELEAIDLSKTESIGDGAFDYCKSLKHADLSNVKHLGYTFVESGLEDVILPMSPYVFSSCYGLKKIIYPEGCKTTYHVADGYQVTSNIEEVVLPESITEIGFGSFEGFSNLREITIPKNVTKIDEYAFVGCGFSSITIPCSVRSIGDYAFTGCQNLTDFYCLSNELEFNLAYNSIFWECPIENATLHATKEFFDKYIEYDPWISFGQYDVIDVIVDAKPYSISYFGELEHLTYERTFYTNVWNAWFVPFAVSSIELQDNGLTPAYIEGIHNYDDDFDGTIDRTIMEVVKITNGTLRAGTPYLIKASEEYTFPLVFDNVLLASKAENHSIHTETTSMCYDIVGTYDGIEASVTSGSGNYYSLGSNNTIEHRVGKILPMRWYLTTTEKDAIYDGHSSSRSRSVAVRVIGEENETTGIRTIYQDEKPLELIEDVFGLDGMKAKYAKKGINIVNGKIVYLK